MFDCGEPVILTVDELSDLCRYYQELLRLQHWDIAIRIARGSEMELAGQGEISWELRNACATIKILDPIDYPPSPFVQDMEKTLVHELLHLHFAPFDDFGRDSLEYKMMERAVDHIAKAMVKQRRSMCESYTSCDNCKPIWGAGSREINDESGSIPSIET